MSSVGSSPLAPPDRPPARPAGWVRLAKAVRHQQASLNDVLAAVEAGSLTVAEARHVLELAAAHLAILRRSAAREGRTQAASGPAD